MTVPDDVAGRSQQTVSYRLAHVTQLYLIREIDVLLLLNRERDSSKRILSLDSPVLSALDGTCLSWSIPADAISVALTLQRYVCTFVHSSVAKIHFFVTLPRIRTAIGLHCGQ